MTNRFIGQEKLKGLSINPDMVRKRFDSLADQCDQYGADHALVCIGFGDEEDVGEFEATLTLKVKRV